ncbi:hypothetical protein [Pseudomonas sp. NPDC079086]|uniref:hypothetical protein n=1 Tax=unclassified Pseudomonas TaxID=196821 RepID=UPI0037CAF9E3
MPTHTARSPFASLAPFRLLSTPAEQALLQNLRRLSQADQSFIQRAVEALAQYPAA